MIRALLLTLIASFSFVAIYAQDGLDGLIVTQEDIVFSEPADNGAASDTLWDFGGNISLTFSQISFTNWAAGGENAFTGNGAVLLTANYEKGLNRWENALDLGYGMTQQGAEKRQIKNEDRIDFSSQYGRKAAEKWFYSAFMGFRSQFFKGYATPGDSLHISNFMAPGYFMASLGMDYKPNANLSILLAPATGRLTVVKDQLIANKGVYGNDPAEYDADNNLVTPGATTRIEMGGFIKIQYQQKFFDEKLHVRSKLELFSNYLEKPQNVDVFWDLSLNFKLGSYITARVQTQLIYDDDTQIGVDTTGDGVLDTERPMVQFREVLGLGFAYNF